MANRSRIGLALLLLAAFAAGAQTRSVVVISHRGEHLHHPENTLAAYRAAIARGADYYEVDLRTTADGRLVLMHDAAVDRTTNGKGKISEMTLAEIRALKVGRERVPTFDEALALARGRAGVYVDTKSASPVDLVAALERQKMLDKVVVYGGFTYLRTLQRLRRAIRIMSEAVDADIATRIVRELRPKVMAFSAQDWRAEIIAIARGAGLDLYVDRLGKADSVPGWRDAIDRGATGIQTDYPGELVQYLRSTGWHK